MTQKQEETMRIALSAVNPFVFRAETGRLNLYKSPLECYELCLWLLFCEFPAGFIDLAYFMIKYQRLSAYQVSLILGQREYAYVRIWDNEDPERPRKLRGVIRTLLTVSGCNFDEGHFGDALSRLDERLEKERAKQEYIKLNNLNII